MNPTILLRSASVIAFLQFVAHTTLFLKAKVSHGAEEQAVVDAMKSHSWSFAGAMRSYWDFYFGYGLMSAVVVLAHAVVLWLLSRAAATPEARPLVTGIAALLLVYNLAHASLAARYFFVTPIIPDVLIVLCLAGALLTLRA